MVAAFGHACGSQRMLRGEQLFRTGRVAISEEGVKEGRFIIKARVSSQDRRSKAPDGGYSTSVVFAPLSADETKAAVDFILSTEAWRRIVALVQSGMKLDDACCRVEAEPLIRALEPKGINLITVNWEGCAAANCSCGDASAEWCKHSAALFYSALAACDSNPFHPFKLRCFDIQGLLSCKKRPRQDDVVIDLVSDTGSDAEHAIDCS